jgi:hypothetical protein
MLPLVITNIGDFDHFFVGKMAKILESNVMIIFFKINKCMSQIAKIFAYCFAKKYFKIHNIDPRCFPV